MSTIALLKCICCTPAALCGASPNPKPAPSPHMHLSAATRASHWACGTWTHLQLHYPSTTHDHITHN